MSSLDCLADGPHRAIIYRKYQLHACLADDFRPHIYLSQRRPHTAHISPANAVFTLPGGWPHTAHQSPTNVVFTLVSRMTSSGTSISSKRRLHTSLADSRTPHFHLSKRRLHTSLADSRTSHFHLSKPRLHTGLEDDLTPPIYLQQTPSSHCQKNSLTPHGYLQQMSSFH